MKKTISYLACFGGLGLSVLSPLAQGVELSAGDWKLAANGHVNANLIMSSCDDEGTAAVAGGLACIGSSGEDTTSTVSNGLLPAALIFGVSTFQNGYDIAATFGFWPGISTNDGGSPNLQQDGGALANTGLGTTGLDIRQVFVTVGNEYVGSISAGRNFGLFGFDAIINDMSIPGVGAPGAAASGAPANTTLGSIGLGYIYTDTLSQINYTTPDFAGLKVTLGIFDPLEPVLQGQATPEATPGFHGKLAYTQGDLYLSASFLSQTNEGPTDAADFDTTAFDLGGKYTMGGLELMAFYYMGSGVGTTALLLNSDDGNGNERDSDGFLAQVTYKLGDTKLGLNYGQSNLDLANGEAVSNLVESNSKFTLGVYHSLTPAVMLVGEFTDVTAEAHDGTENNSSTINAGIFVGF